MEDADSRPIRAPQRGRYDRSRSRQERQSEQHDRLLASIAAIAMRSVPTLALVVQHAGVGRNTFYEYFDDIPHALRVVEARALQELGICIERAGRGARTPLERVRQLISGWLDAIDAEPEMLLIALQPGPSRDQSAQLSSAALKLVLVLERMATEADARAALSGCVDAVRIRAVAAIFDALSREYAWLRDSRSSLQRQLFELCLKILR